MEKKAVARYRISKRFGGKRRLSGRALSVMRMFGVTAERLIEKSFSLNCELEINAGEIVYITGPSGAGKSVLLRELERSVAACERVNLAEIEAPSDRSVIDCIDGDVVGALKVLSVAGLSDVFCILGEAGKLSDGQKWRFRLAAALASGKRFIFADEFCSGLDRITAAVISYQIHKFAKRGGVSFVLASSHEDVLADLGPDVLVRKELDGATEIIYKRLRNRDGRVQCG
ncbi:MAG: ATP-binding cassette domain-containing protein [Planctomycetota bacterium]|jgi:ABC-type ATPase with predicted acetyltransferase domain